MKKFILRKWFAFLYKCKRRYEKFCESRKTLAIVMLAIGVIWTGNYYEFKELQKDYDRTIVIYNTAKTNRQVREHNKQQESLVIEVQKQEDNQVKEWEGTVEVSAYTASVDETDSRPREMASGKEVYIGAVACPRDWEFGTKVELENLGTFICEDRMNIRYTNNVDIYMETKAEAYAFGRKKDANEIRYRKM